MSIDFSALARAALEHVDTLLTTWLPDGRREGHEYKALNPTRSDSRQGSFSINCTTGAWADFATDDKGGDLVSLCAYLFHDSNQAAAARELSSKLNISETVQETRKRKPEGKPPRASPPLAPPSDTGDGWQPVLPVPDDAPPPPKAHEFRGIPSMIWQYLDSDGRLLGMVCRFEKKSGGKEIVPLTFCRHPGTSAQEWRWLSFPVPRPLYGLDRLAAHPAATVLVVEGEKCADAAAAALPDLVVVSWLGGAGAVDKTDWRPLVGRKVITWADADSQREKCSKTEKDASLVSTTKPYLAAEKQPGFRAMAKIRSKLAGHCKLWNIPLPAPGTLPNGYDVADMLAKGVPDGLTLADYLRRQAKPIKTTSSPPDACAGKVGEPPEGWDSSDAENWRDALLYDKKGELVPCLANVYDILAHRPEWQGVLAWDEFAGRVVKLDAPRYAGGVAGEWDAVDDSRTAIWLTRREHFSAPSGLVAEAVETLAHHSPVHPVREWLKSRPAWDGISRCEMWLSDFLGVLDSTYVRLVSKFFLLGMVARVMKPGCKFDYCLVLEGTQGKGKSSALRTLAGKWFADTDLDLHNKDSMSSLAGVWLYEFAELGAVARAEATRQKSFLSRQYDKYRPVYGRRDVNAPRQCVFAGTTNDWEWQKDPTGGRRFWPVEVIERIDLEGLVVVRDQLFAEALLLYEAGARYWPSPDEQVQLFDPEQLRREQPDSLVDALHDWVFSQVADFSVAAAISDGLKLVS